MTALHTDGDAEEPELDVDWFSPVSFKARDGTSVVDPAECVKGVFCADYVAPQDGEGGGGASPVHARYWNGTIAMSGSLVRKSSMQEGGNSWLNHEANMIVPSHTIK